MCSKKQKQQKRPQSPRNAREGIGPKSTGRLHYDATEGAARLAQAWGCGNAPCAGCAKCNTDMQTRKEA